MKIFKKIIQVEMNEVSLELLKANRSSLPNFSTLLERWNYCETSSEKRYEDIEPWIQWVSAHTGKSLSEHGVYRLSDSNTLTVPQLWESLSANGIESAVVGCMNASRGETSGGLFFPDPWAKAGKAYPHKLQSLWNLISSRVQSHATRESSLDEVFKGVGAAMNFNLPSSLFVRIGSQFLRQKLDPSKRWMLAGLFDEFLSALFLNILRETNFGYNALFLNSVAHYQHHFWRQHQPGKFNKNIACPDCAPSDDPISFGLATYDRILGDVMKSATDPDTLLVVATGLSQIPYLASENKGGMHYYRLKDHRTFATRLGIERCKVFPLMSRDWQLASDSDADLKAAEGILRSLTVGGESLFNIQRNSDSTLFIETAITEGDASKGAICLAGSSSLGAFSDFFASVAVKSGCHSGTGHLWTSAPLFEDRKIPLTQLYSASLAALGAKCDT